MPFDICIANDPVLRTLIAVDERLATEDDWCQDTDAMDSARCIIGAFESVGGTLKIDTFKFCRALGFIDVGYVTAWNDDPGRTFADVKERIQRAIAKRTAELLQ